MKINCFKVFSGCSRYKTPPHVQVLYSIETKRRQSWSRCEFGRSN